MEDACVTGIPETENVKVEARLGWDERKKMSAEVPCHRQPVSQWLARNHTSLETITFPPSMELWEQSR